MKCLMVAAIDVSDYAATAEAIREEGGDVFTPPDDAPTFGADDHARPSDEGMIVNVLHTAATRAALGGHLECARRASKLAAAIGDGTLVLVNTRPTADALAGAARSLDLLAAGLRRSI